MRVNSIETGLAEDDLRMALTAKVLPHSIVVPKVETAEHIDWVNFVLSKNVCSYCTDSYNAGQICCVSPGNIAFNTLLIIPCLCQG